MIFKLKEEILDENKRQESSIKSNLIILLLHMLKYKYQEEYENKNSWINSIYNALTNIITEFTCIGKGALYKNFYMKKLNLSQLYKIARSRAARETGIDINTFPEHCEWSKNQLIDVDFIDTFLDEYQYN